MVAPWSSAAAPQSNLHISNSVSDDVRSAPPFRTSVASPFTRCLPFHLSWRQQPLPSRHFLVSRRTESCKRAVATFHNAKLCPKKMTSSSLVPFERSEGTRGWKPSRPTPVAESSCPFCRLSSLNRGKRSSSLHSFLHGVSAPFCISELPLLLASPRGRGIFFKFLYHLQPNSNQWVCLRSMLLLLQWLKTSFPIVDGLPHLIDLFFFLPMHTTPASCLLLLS